jgi:hypothetical protein
MITRLTVTISISLFFIRGMPLLGADHPRMPVQTLPQVTTTFPQNAPTKEVSNADISAGIKRHIVSERKQSSDKKFHLRFRGKDLALDLMKVHDDRLSSLGGGNYFACVDMKGTDGTMYDIDFFMAGQPGSMKVTETSVHKINGKPLYNWKEQGGVWKKMRVS